MTHTSVFITHESYNSAEALAVAERLNNLGYAVTSTWHDQEMDTMKLSMGECMVLLKSDILLLLPSSLNRSLDIRVGIAFGLALSIGTKLFIVGRCQPCFDLLSCVHFANIDEVFDNYFMRLASLKSRQS